MNDRTYRAWVLDNPIRRLLAHPRREVRRLDPRPGDRVIDLGAGVGYYADATLARLGAAGRLTLVDINGANLQRYVRRHGPDPRVETIVGSAASLPTVASETMDRALLANVICDLVDKRGVLDEAWRVLRPDGLALVSFHWKEKPDPARPLRVTPQVWESLRSAHPWEEVARGGGRRIQWHLLRKPVGSVSPPPGDVGIDPREAR